MICQKCDYKSEIEEEFLAIQGNIGIPSNDGTKFGGIIGQNIWSLEDIIKQDKRFKENKKMKNPSRMDMDRPLTTDLGGGYVLCDIFCRECIRSMLSSDTIIKAIRVKRKLKVI